MDEDEDDDNGTGELKNFDVPCTLVLLPTCGFDVFGAISGKEYFYLKERVPAWVAGKSFQEKHNKDRNRCCGPY